MGNSTNSDYRIFVTEIRDAADPAKIAGYAISERVAYISTDAAEREPAAAVIAAALKDALAAAGRGAPVMRTMGFKSANDPKGRGQIVHLLSTLSTDPPHDPN